MGGYRLLPAAEVDVDEQAGHLSDQAGLETALRFYDAANITLGKLARMPNVGERWKSSDDRLADLRVWRIEGFENHLVFYRVVDDGIDVVRILHGARNITRALLSGPLE